MDAVELICEYKYLRAHPWKQFQASRAKIVLIEALRRA